MIIPDLNLLVYAYNKGAAEHVRAKEWWEQLLNSGVAVAIPWIVVLGFIRLTTTRGVLAQPASWTDACQRVEEWLQSPGVTLLNPGAHHLGELKKTLPISSAGPRTTDAHLAALAIEHQAELHSNDLDFGRFSGLRWHNPLAEDVPN